MTRKETATTEAIVAAVTAVVSKDMANIVNTAVNKALKEFAANNPTPVVKTAAEKPTTAAATVPVAKAAVKDNQTADGRPADLEAVAVNKDEIREVIKYVEVEKTSDASIAALVAMGSALIGSAGYDLLFGDTSKSTLDIVIDSCNHSLASGVLAYSGTTLFAPRDNSALSITAMGLAASSLIVGTDKAIRHFSNSKQESSESNGSILENLTR